MKTQGAVLWGPGQDWQIEEVELGDPRVGEVEVRLASSGICHSDEHVRTGGTQIASWPFLGGHEGAGVVTRVGPGVRSLSEGDHVVLAFVPACGRCSACSAGHQNLCELAANTLTGRSIADDTYRATVRGQGAVTMCLLGTFAPYVVVNEASAVKIEDDIPLDVASLLGCGVPTGWGSAVRAADVRPGHTVVVAGIGGVGANAVQGARAAGALNVVAIDPVPFKREQAKLFGATHVFASMTDAVEPVRDLTWGAMANSGILTVGQVEGEHIGELFALLGKLGTGVVTGMATMSDTKVTLGLFAFSCLEQRLQGVLFGNGSPRSEIPRLAHLYRNGEIKLDELITRRYRLEDINEAMADMQEGRNIRGMIMYDDAHIANVAAVR